MNEDTILSAIERHLHQPEFAERLRALLTRHGILRPDPRERTRRAIEAARKLTSAGMPLAEAQYLLRTRFRVSRQTAYVWLRKARTH